MDAAASVLDDRALMVVKFARSRAAELGARTSKLLADKDAAPGGGRRVFQRLPRHLRRRAMNHNVHRLPPSARKEGVREFGLISTERVAAAKRTAAIDQQRRKRHKLAQRARRYWRRPARVQADHERRQKTHRWLPGTHVWHAKRMVMVKRWWGFATALKRSDKGLRASFRSACHSCTVHDASYLSCLQISGTSAESVATVLSRHCDARDAAALARTASFGRAGSLLFHRADTCPSGALCPCSFLWCVRPESARVWLWVHPAAVEDVFTQLKASCEGSSSGISVTNRSGEFVRYELTGPRSTNVLLSSLPPAPLAISDPQVLASATELGRGLLALTSPASLPANVTMAYVAITPKSPPVVSNPIIARGAPAQGSRTFDAVKLAVGWDSKYGKQVEASASPLWAETLPEWAAPVATAEAAAQKGGETAKKRKKREESPKTVPLILIQRPGNCGAAGRKRSGFGSGWDLIAPVRAALKIWLSLVFHAAHAIGSQERDWTSFEAGDLVFPRDYPDTPAHAKESLITEAELSKDYRSKPPSKRPPYLKVLRVKSPFRSDWQLVVRDLGVSGHVVRSRAELQNLTPTGAVGLVRGTVSFRSGGKPTDRAIVCSLEPEDRNLLAQNRDPPLDRPPIGFCTSAGFSYTTGHGAATAFISSAAVLSSKCRPFEVLVRNVTSARSYPATFIPILS